MKKVVEWISSMIVFVILFGLAVWLLKASVGDEPIANNCQQGYHWEEDYRGTVGGCVHD